ncbi:MAG TPA: hypothetical protein VF062_23085 [Candidatus Limnocylindrales bacterium]
MTNASTLLLTEPQAHHVTDAVAASPSLSHVGGSLNLSGPMRGRVAQDVTETMRTLIEIPFLEVLVAAWRSHHSVRAAAQANSPEVRRVVLASHQVSSAHHPYVEFLVNDAPMAVANFHLQLVFKVDSLVAGIQSGRLVGIEVAKCDVTATLHFEQIKVAEAHRPVDPHLELRLPPEGISLADPPPGEDSVRMQLGPA